MPRRNPKLAKFYHVFSAEEAKELADRFYRMAFQRNVKDPLVLCNVCDILARQLHEETSDARWHEENVKTFVANNVRLYRLFCDYVNATDGVRFNKVKNRVAVSSEYWHFVRKENEDQRLFRECGFPQFEMWTKIMYVHEPGEVIFIPVGTTAAAPILIKDEPFDADAADPVDAMFPSVHREPIRRDKLFTL